MKKTIAVVLCCVLIFTFQSAAFTNESDKSVAGLEECLNELWMVNSFSQEEIDQMDKQYINEFNRRWPSYLPGLKATSRRKLGTDEEEYQRELDNAQLNYDNGILSSVLNTTNYAEQYAESGNFEYLFADNKYWSVPRYSSYGGCSIFSVDGNYIREGYTKEVLGESGIFTVLPPEAVDFLRNTIIIEGILSDKGEESVSDIRIFPIADSITSIYIKGGNQEYLMKILQPAQIFGEDLFKELDLFKLYTAKEFLEAVSQYGKGLAASIATTKPIYTAEAESLQVDGLLNGNEKGLDLLKPLTRIEATTLLVRALGLENEETDTISKFVDIPNGNWGVRYANIAADKGITNGIGDDKFAPNTLVTDNQFATMLLRSVKESDFDWKTGINLLIEKGIISEEESKTMDLFTRGDMAKIIYEAREKSLIAN